MKTVSGYEAHLLRVLAGLLHRAPVAQTAALLGKPRPRPPCLSRDAVELVKDALAKGCVGWLARHGWPRDPFLRGDRPAAGRLWERVPPAELGLSFSRHALDFVLGLVAGQFGGRPPFAALTVGDRLLFLLALDALPDSGPRKLLVGQWTPLSRDGLSRLFFLEDFLGPAAADWRVWTAGVGGHVLEALQEPLAGRLVVQENFKGSLSDPARMRRVGETQAAVWGGYLDAIDAAGRRDLARCFLIAAHRVLHDAPPATRWLGALRLRNERLADRTAIYRAAFALLHVLDRLHGWQQQARLVGYFDEGYAAAQLVKADWERWQGDVMHRRAQALIREGEPLRA